MIAYRDRATGAQVLQVTDGPAISHPTYFLQSSFFPGDREMFFTSYRTGAAQLFEVSLASGAPRQITSGEAIHPFSPALHPDGETLVVTRGGALWAIHRRTLAERRIASAIPDGATAQLGECSISRNGEWLTAAFKAGPQCGLVVGRFDGTGWHTIPFPRTVIHPQFHPLEPEWIEFSGDPAPRMHRVRRDGSGLECIYQHGNDEFLVHETFLGDTGDLVFTIWPRALCRMDWSTRQIRTIVEYNAWHIAPDRRGQRILCDTNHPDEGLQIIDASTGVRRQLCLSESSNQGSQWRRSRYALAEDFAQARNTLSWMEAAADTVYGPQWSHPHPSWSSAETKVAFASDRTGTTQVYVAEMHLVGQPIVAAAAFQAERPQAGEADETVCPTGPSAWSEM
jgi:oligogalacturonide lyase